MTLELTSPYPNHELDDKEIGQIIEDFLKENWIYPSDENDPGYVAGLTSEDIAWGVHASDMSEARKEITVRAFQIFSDVRDMALGGALNGNFELWWIDIWVSDPKATGYRSQKLQKVLRAIKKILLLNKTTMQESGLSSVNVYKATPVQEPEFKDLFHGIIGVEVRYVENIVEV